MSKLDSDGILVLVKRTTLTVPPGVSVPDNCLAANPKGAGISEMASGDYDGDIAMVVWATTGLRSERRRRPGLYVRSIALAWGTL